MLDNHFPIGKDSTKITVAANLGKVYRDFSSFIITLESEVQQNIIHTWVERLKTYAHGKLFDIEDSNGFSHLIGTYGGKFSYCSNYNDKTINRSREVLETIILGTSKGIKDSKCHPKLSKFLGLIWSGRVYYLSKSRKININHFDIDELESVLGVGANEITMERRKRTSQELGR